MPWETVNGTMILKALNPHQQEEALQLAAGILKKGKIVAFPTETVYGLGADALNPEAVSQIYDIKMRPADNPLIVHVTGLDQLAELVLEIPSEASILAGYFWPGPLTIVLPKKELVPDITTAGLSSVAVRVPSHPLALKLIGAAGLPVAAPSANLSGRPSPTTAEHVLEDLAGRIEAVLDGGPSSVGVESTVISLVSKLPALLRPGGVTLEMLENVLGKKILDLTNSGKEIRGIPPAPGMKYRHYAPKAPLYLVEGDEAFQRQQLVSLSEGLIMQGRKVGMLVCEESKELFSAQVVKVMGSRREPQVAAERLFSALREMDKLEVDAIVAEGFDEKGMGRAVINRLRKAAVQVIKQEP
ncbi:MAG: L-threonylcarbamoyladenylate synthase [Bacillota bacterium]|nr:L-threonylcarbamoyladenylate synthase [Bacillota bacterium]